MAAGTLVSFPVRFSKVKVSVQFTIAGSGQVAGLFFRPADAPLPQEWKRPAYSHPDAFREREVVVGSDEWKLPGALTVPIGKGPFAAVVLIHGPGPNDRDETFFSNRPFRDLAEGLASRGFVVLRYDKRTKVYGEKMSSTYYTLREEVVEDAVRAIGLVRRQPEVDPKRVFVLGHSLGGYAVPRIATGKHLAGAIILAGNARPIEDVVLEENEYLMQLKNGGSPEEHARFEALKAEIARVKQLAPGKNNPSVVLGLPAAYLLDLQGYNPAAEARKLAMPLLILQGERDIQVSTKDFARWKAGLGQSRNVTFRSYATLNHLFIAGEGPGSPAEYRYPGNVAPVVIDDIAKWLRSR